MGDLDAYDAGLLGDGGGGDVEWWQDYMRDELGRAHDFYQSQIPTNQRYEVMRGALKAIPGGYLKPFYVDDRGDEIIVRDAGDCNVMSFGRYTQLPLDDEKALADDRAEWIRFAEWLAARMNMPAQALEAVHESAVRKDASNG